MEKGERWAYEIPKKYNLAQVLVEKIGTKRPPRVLITFLDDEYEGASEWVTPGRLKVLWADVDAYRAREQAWEELREDGLDLTEVEGFAVEHVLMDSLADSVATRLLSSKDFGLIGVHDWQAIEQFTGQARAELLRGAHLIEDGTTYCSWSTTVAIAAAYCRLHADEILRALEKFEQVQRRESIYGRLERRQGREHYTEPEYAAEWYDDYMAPMIEIVRGWCGEARAERDELNELRRELWQNSDRVNRAIQYLLLNNDEPRAWSLHSEMYPDAVRKKWKSAHQLQLDHHARLKREVEVEADMARQTMNEHRVEVEARLERERADALGYDPPPWAIAD